MSSFTLPETVLGIPLFVPSFHNYFQIDTAAMPNGDSALIVNGGVSDQYKAFLPAPTLSPRNIFNAGDYGSGHEWAMSCWLKLSNLSSYVSGAVMLGCSGEQSIPTPTSAGRNASTPFMLVPSSTSAFCFFREPLNNIASPSSSQNILVQGSWAQFQDYWFLQVFNLTTAAGVSPTVSAYMDGYESAQASDNAGGTASGAYTGLPQRYLHIGAYHNSGVGRADQWRIAKWAFHDHALTAVERQSMWAAMYGAGPFVYQDSFNRASLGNNWILISGNTAFDILSNQARASGQTFRAMMYARDIGSPNHYAQAVVVNSLGLHAQVLTRVVPYAATNLEHYSGGRSGSNWIISRRGTTVASVSAGGATPPYTIRLETTTNLSGNVELNLKYNGTSVLTYTDTDATRILTSRNAGLYPRGNTGVDQLMDDFECGTL